MSMCCVLYVKYPHRSLCTLLVHCVLMCHFPHHQPRIILSLVTLLRFARVFFFFLCHSTFSRHLQVNEYSHWTKSTYSAYIIYTHSDIAYKHNMFLFSQEILVRLYEEKECGPKVNFLCKSEKICAFIFPYMAIKMYV